MRPMGGIKLKPCPFCGSAQVVYFRGEQRDRRIIYGMVCWGCKAMGPKAPNEEQAEEAWNRRAQ